MSKATVEVVCEYCGAKAVRRKDNVTESRKNGSPDTCSMTCAQRLRASNKRVVSVDSLLALTTKTDSGCLEWNRSLNADGYAQIVWTEKYGRRPVGVHKVIYELIHGDAPKGMCVCHTCDNRKCINPEHLWIGTVAENNADMKSKGRWRRDWRPARHVGR